MGITERKIRERGQRTALFIDTARSLFFEKGFEATAMEEIAKAAEFSKRTLYLYFRDKKELYLAVVGQGLDILAEMVEKTEKRGNGWDLIRALGETYFQFAMNYTDYFNAIIYFESHDYAHGPEPVQAGPYAKACWERNNKITEVVHAAVARGLNEGSIRTSLTPIQLTLLFWSQLAGVIQTLSRRRGILEIRYGISVRELFDQHWVWLERGIAGVKPDGNLGPLKGMRQ